MVPIPEAFSDPDFSAGALREASLQAGTVAPDFSPPDARSHGRSLPGCGFSAVSGARGPRPAAFSRTHVPCVAAWSGLAAILNPCSLEGLQACRLAVLQDCRPRYDACRNPPRREPERRLRQDHPRLAPGGRLRRRRPPRLSRRPRSPGFLRQRVGPRTAEAPVAPRLAPAGCGARSGAFARSAAEGSSPTPLRIHTVPRSKRRGLPIGCSFPAVRRSSTRRRSPTRSPSPAPPRRRSSSWRRRRPCRLHGPAMGRKLPGGREPGDHLAGESEKDRAASSSRDGSPSKRCSASKREAASVCCAS